MLPAKSLNMMAARFFLLMALWYAAAARVASAEDCDAAVQRVIQATGATLKRKTELGNYHLWHPLASSFVVSCGILPFGVSVAFDGPKPPNGLFDLVGRAGSALIGETQANVTRSAQECHQEATMTDPDGLGCATSPKAEIECGEGVINVFRPQHRCRP